MEQEEIIKLRIASYKKIKPKTPVSLEDLDDKCMYEKKKNAKDRAPGLAFTDRQRS
jgi:hypothetical protein